MSCSEGQGSEALNGRMTEGSTGSTDAEEERTGDSKTGGVGRGGDREACVWRGELPRWQVRASLCLALPAGCAESHHSPDGEPR